MSYLKNFFLFFCLIYAVFLSSQPNIEWENSYGGTGFEYGESILQTNDGGYIIAGNTNSTDGDVSINHGIFDFWVVRLDASGEIIWEKTFGGSDYDNATTILESTDGNYVIFGSTSSVDGDILINHGDSDFWLIKVNQEGELLWQKTYGGSGSDKGLSIQLTKDGGYVMCGTSNSSDGDVSKNNGNSDFWIVKIDGQGNIDWEKSYGGSSSEQAFSVHENVNQEYIVAGFTESNDKDITENKGEMDFWVLKLDSKGDLIWQKTLGGSGLDFAFEVELYNNGDFVLTGYTNSKDGDVLKNIGSEDFWILKLNTNGEIIWQNTLGSPGSDAPSMMSKTKQGGILVVGYVNAKGHDVANYQGGGDYWVVKLNNVGVIEWEKTFGGSGIDQANAFSETSDKSFIITGISGSIDGEVTQPKGSYDVWVVKLEGEIVDVLETNNKNKITISPNPVTDQIIITSLEKINLVRVYDYVGKLIQEERSNIFSVEHLISGNYIIQIETSTGTISQKFTKK